MQFLVKKIPINSAIRCKCYKMKRLNQFRTFFLILGILMITRQTLRIWIKSVEEINTWSNMYQKVVSLSRILTITINIPQKYPTVTV